MSRAHYLLPSSPSILCEDRFSILDSNDLYVPFWSLFSTLLGSTKVNSPATLIDVLETIAVVRRGRTDTDYGFLKDFLLNLKRPGDFYDQVWPTIRGLALDMPVLFPDRRLPILSGMQTKLVLTRRQTACLVVHQFLCTLTAPTWQDGFQDFHIWYSADQPHAKAVEAYLTALFEYFSRLANEEGCSPLQSNSNEWTIEYSLHTAHDAQLHGRGRSTMLVPLEVIKLPEATTSPLLLGLEDGATVISANKFIGFGRTGTQEETHVGASPECCPAVLITPPLDDSQVLVVTGPEAMISIAGYGREARCSEILAAVKDGVLTKYASKWRRRTMLFMDALELDLFECDSGLADLQPGNVDRELRKAHTAFHSYHQLNRAPFSKIYTGYWGCGSFGGNPGVKALIQWCAASVAGSSLSFVCFGDERGAFGDQLGNFVTEVREHCTPGMIMEVLRDMKPENVSDAESVLTFVRKKIRERTSLVSE